MGKGQPLRQIWNPPGQSEARPQRCEQPVHQQIAFTPSGCTGVQFKTFLGPLLIRTRKENPSRNVRRPQHLVSPMSRNRVGAGKLIYCPLIIAAAPVVSW